MQARVLSPLLLAASTLLAGPTDANASGAAEQAEAVAEEDAAKQLLKRGNYREAASAYEELWGRKAEPRFLFNAAMARELAGHELQAFTYLRQYLQIPAISAEERTKAEARLSALEARTKALRLIVAPALLDPQTLRLTLVRVPDGSASDAGRVPVVLAGGVVSSIGVPKYDGAFELAIEAGEWKLEVAADEYRTQTLRVVIDASKVSAQVVVRLVRPGSDEDVVKVPVTFVFEPAQAVAAGIDVTLEGPTRQQQQQAEQQRYQQSERVTGASHTWQLIQGNWSLEAKAPRFRPTRVTFVAVNPMTPLRVRLEPMPTRETTILLGALGGVGFVSGTIVTAVYGARFARHLGEFDAATDDETGDAGEAKRALDAMEYDRAYRLHGVATLGMGFGFGVGALTAGLEHRMERPGRVWVGEAVAGAGLAIVAFSLSWVVPRVGYRDAVDSQYCGSSAVVAQDAKFCSKGERADPGGVAKFVHQSGAGNFFGGLGVGLLTSGVVGLVKLAIQKRGAGGKVAVSSASGRLTMNF